MKPLTLLLLISFTSALVLAEPDYKLRRYDPGENWKVTDKVKVSVRGLPRKPGEKTYYVSPGTNLFMFILKTLILNPLTEIEVILVYRKNDDAFIYAISDKRIDPEKSLKSFILDEGDRIHIMLIPQPMQKDPSRSRSRMR